VYDNEILNFYANSNVNCPIVATLSPDHTSRKKVLQWKSFAIDAYSLDVTCINDILAFGARSIEPNLKGHAGMEYFSAYSLSPKLIYINLYGFNVLCKENLKARESI
jgi:hypothetical protein